MDFPLTSIFSLFYRFSLIGFSICWLIFCPRISECNQFKWDGLSWEDATELGRCFHATTELPPDYQPPTRSLKGKNNEYQYDLNRFWIFRILANCPN